MLKYTVEALLKLDAEGLSYGEIAEKLGTTRGAIGGKIRRLAAEGYQVRTRRLGLHPLGKRPASNSRKKTVEVVQPDIAEPKKQAPNRNTFYTGPTNYRHVSKAELYAQLHQAVKNTK